MIYFPKLVDLQIFAKNEGVWGRCYDSWQDQESVRTDHRLDTFDPFDSGYEKIHPITHPIGMYGGIYVYILFNVYWAFQSYRSTVQRIVALSGRTLGVPQKSDLIPSRTSSYIVGTSQNFFPKNIGA
mgnify:FL=1